MTTLAEVSRTRSSPGLSRLARAVGTLALLALTSLAALPAFGQGAQAQKHKQADNTPVSPEAWQQRGKTFQFEDQAIFYVDEGDGTPVVLLHGYPTSSWDFNKIWSGLLPGHRLIAPDFLGYGFSAKPKSYPYSVAKHADMIEALVQSAQIDDVQLVAHDIGVAVLEELVARDQEGTLPFKIKSVVLLNGTLFASEYQPRPIQRLLASPIGGLVNKLASEKTLSANLRQISGATPGLSDDELAAYWALLNYPGDARVTHRLTHTTRDRAANDERWAKAFCASTFPLRLVIGPEDPTSGVRLSESLTQRCGVGRTFSEAIIDGAGHFPHVEKPEQTLASILNWSEGGY